MKLIEDVGFDQSFSFIYSRRPGTPAADVEDDVPLDVKKATPGAIAGNGSATWPQLISRRMVGTSSGCWWSAIAKGSGGDRRAHGKQPGGKLRAGRMS